HTRSKRDWSSDVCSSDLLKSGGRQGCALRARREGAQHLIAPGGSRPEPAALPGDRDHTEAMESPDQVTDCCPGLREDDRLARPEIGRASCREREEVAVVA